MNAEPTNGDKMKKTIKELDEARIKAYDAWEKAEKAWEDSYVAWEEADDALNAARLARKSIKLQSEDD
jgi:hypothetical protein